MKNNQHVKDHLGYGDYSKIAKMVGISRNHAIQIMRRPTAKRYNEVLRAAEKVARANRKLGV